jgi:hypothetical protein
MKYVLIALILCLSAMANAQNTQSPEQIRQQMAKIRQTTNWDDPEAAKKANEEIKKLAKQLMMGGNQQQGQNMSPDDQKKTGLDQGMADYKMGLFSKIWEIGMQGEGADALMGEPLRKEIVEEYKEDDNNNAVNQTFLDEMPVLIINISMPGINAVIDQMPNFKGIKTLIVESGDSPLPVNLNTILKNASGYPLETLYIINFKFYVRSVPPEVSGFPDLTVLGLFNNNISEIPQSITKLKELKELYIDMNPVATIFPWIESLTSLEKLGIEKTSVPESEREKISKLIPTCQIMKQ